MKLCYINCSGLVCFETHCIFTILFNFVFDVALWSRYVEVAAVYRWILRMKLRFWLFKTFRLITLVNFHYFMIQRLASWTEHPALLCPWPSICLSVCLSVSVCPSITYISNNSRTQRPNLDWRFPTLDATHTLVSTSNDQRSGLEEGGGIPCRPNPAATLLVLP